MPQFFGAYATAARGGQSDLAARLEVASLLIGAGADPRGAEEPPIRGR